MKDGLDPYGSSSAAYMNQVEFDKLGEVGDVAKKILQLSSKLGGVAVSAAFPAIPTLLNGPLSSLADLLVGIVAGNTKVNVEQFAYCVVHDLQCVVHDQQKLGSSFDKLDELLSSVRDQQLFLQGAIEASTSATQERTMRLAKVVVSGILRPNDPDEMVTEFLRMTSALIETDVHVLRVTARLQEPSSDPIEEVDQEEKSKRGDNRRTKLYKDWPQILADVESKGLSDMSVRSAFVRLQALGLVEPITSGFDAGEPRYEVLELGRLYVDYLYDLRNDSDLGGSN